MRFLVTGGAGFLGSALANRLVSDGHEVRALDNLLAGDQERLDRRVLFERGDVADIPKLWTLLQGVDCVYHLAARVSVPESMMYPRDYNHVNVGGTVSLMEATRDAGIRRVVLTSSGAVYGNQDKQPLHEALTLNPGSPYAVSKIAAEIYVRTIGAQWGIETVSLRIFNAYGPGQHLPPSHPPVVPHFLRQALRGGTLVVHGDGNQTRDYVYVDDVVSAMIAAATAPDVNGAIINVGSGTENSIRELVRKVGEVTGSELDSLYNSNTSGGVSRMQADLTLAAQKLNYKPSIELDEGLRLTLQRDSRFQ